MSWWFGAVFNFSVSTFYILIFAPSPKFLCVSPDPQCGSICAGGLWEVIRGEMRPRRWGPHDGIVLKTIGSKLSPPTLWEGSEGPLYKPGRDRTRNRPCWHLDLGLWASRAVRNKFLLFKLRFVMVIWADSDKDIRQLTNFLNQERKVYKKLKEKMSQ